MEDLVGDLFVDRHEELRLCRKWVEDIPKVPVNSLALAGRRRTGKTAILVKLFNELFCGQDRVLPVFITFADYLDRREPISFYDFAKEYFSGYLRCYLAFRHGKPMLVRGNATLRRTDGGMARKLILGSGFSDLGQNPKPSVQNIVNTILESSHSWESGEAIESPRFRTQTDINI